MSSSIETKPLLERATDFFIKTSQLMASSLHSHTDLEKSWKIKGKDAFVYPPFALQTYHDDTIVDEVLKAGLFPRVFCKFILTERWEKPVLKDSELAALGIFLHKSMLVRDKSIMMLNQIKSGFRLVYDTFNDRFCKVGKQETVVNFLPDYDDHSWSRMARVLAPLLDFRNDLKPEHLKVKDEIKTALPQVVYTNLGRFNLDKFLWIIESLERSKSWSKIGWKKCNILDGRAPFLFTLLQLFTESRDKYLGVIQYNEHELRKLLDKLEEDKNYENELRKSDNYKHYYNDVSPDTLNLVSLSINYRRMFKSVVDPDCGTDNPQCDGDFILSPHNLDRFSKEKWESDLYRKSDDQPCKFDYKIYNYFNRKISNFGYLYHAGVILNHIKYPEWGECGTIYTDEIMRFTTPGLNARIMSVFQSVNISNFQYNSFKCNLQEVIFDEDAWVATLINDQLYSQSLVHEYLLTSIVMKNNMATTGSIEIDNCVCCKHKNQLAKELIDVKEFCKSEDSSWEFIAWLCQMVFRLLLKDPKQEPSESNLVDNDSPLFNVQNKKIKKGYKKGILEKIIYSSIIYLYEKTTLKKYYSDPKGILTALEVYKSCFQSEILIALDGLYYKIGSSAKGVDIFCRVFDVFLKLKIINRKICLSHYLDKSEKHIPVQRRNRGLFEYEREIVFKVIEEYYKVNCLSFN